MNILIIGGTRFVGTLLGWRLLAAGHRVTLLNRGTRPNPFGDRVEHLRADRTTDAFTRVLANRRFDATVDFAAYTELDARGVLAHAEALGHYVLISSGQVYLVRHPRPVLATEADYDGPLMPRPTAPADASEWDYGVGKRGCEDALCSSSMPHTILRLPMINGELDYYRRIEGYLWRLLDGGPLLLPGGGQAPLRHVYGDDVARLIVSLLSRPATFGRAYNVAQLETPTLIELLEHLASRLGVTAASSTRRLELLSIAHAQLEDATLAAVEVSPFSGQWMSYLDPSRAIAELELRQQPLTASLDSIVAHFLAAPPAAPPPGYRHRAAELALARTLGG